MAEDASLFRPTPLPLDCLDRLHRLLPAALDEAAQKGLRRGAVPLLGAFEAAELGAVAVDEDAGRQAAHAEGLAERRFGVEIGLQYLEVELLEKGIDDMRPAAVLRHQDDGEIRALHGGCEAVERRHLADAGLAPGGPEIDQQDAAAEIGEA